LPKIGSLTHKELCQIRNRGNAATGTFSVQWFLSNDAAGSSEDVLLTLASGASSSAHTAIAAGGFGAKQTISLKLPTTAPSGFSGMNFFLIMKTDSANLVSETNEANNFGQIGDAFDREKIVISPRSTTFGSFDAWDASTDDNINSVMSDGALRVNYNFNLSAPKLTKMTLEAVGQSNAVTTLADFGTSSVGVQRLVNLATAQCSAAEFINCGSRRPPRVAFSILPSTRSRFSLSPALSTTIMGER